MYLVVKSGNILVENEKRKMKSWKKKKPLPIKRSDYLRGYTECLLV